MSVSALATLAATAAWGQPARHPAKPVEIVFPMAVGSSSNVACVMQKILHEQKVLTTPVVIMNKSGGNQMVDLGLAR